MSRPAHGGRLREAARRRGIPLDAWLDLSTGISPWSYPLPALPEEVWRRLPEEDDGLEPYEVYYGIKADDMTVLTDSGYVTDGCVVALTGNPEKLEQAVKVIEMLLDCLP